MQRRICIGVYTIHPLDFLQKHYTPSALQESYIIYTLGHNFRFEHIPSVFSFYDYIIGFENGIFFTTLYECAIHITGQANKY